MSLQGRSDDNIETIKKRFRVFLEQSMPVIASYEKQGKVRCMMQDLGHVGKHGVPCFPNLPFVWELLTLQMCCSCSCTAGSSTNSDLETQHGLAPLGHMHCFHIVLFIVSVQVARIDTNRPVDEIYKVRLILFLGSFVFLPSTVWLQTHVPASRM